MADINNVNLDAGGSPTVRYNITYTKTRLSNSKMRYVFTIKTSLISSSAFLGTGIVINAAISVADGGGTVRVKNSDESWSGSGVKDTATITIDSTSYSANTAQTVAFVTNRDGGSSGTAGVIANYSYTVTSSALLPTACLPPTNLTLGANIVEESIRLTWSGASSGVSNSITGYNIQYATSADNISWRGWANLTETTASTYLVYVTSILSRGDYIRFRVQTKGSAGSSYYSTWSNASPVARRNSLPNPPTTFYVSPETYSQGDILTLAWSGASDIDGGTLTYTLSERHTISGAWTSYNTLYTALTAQSINIEPTQAEDGEKIQYQIIAVDSLGAQSTPMTSPEVVREDGTASVGVNQVWTKSEIYVGVNGTWKKAKTYAGVKGEWLETQ